MMRDTLIASEDQRFRRHHGVDWLAIIGAVRDRIAGRRGRGASPLPMQLAGFLSPDLAAPGASGWPDQPRPMRAARAIEAAVKSVVEGKGVSSRVDLRGR